MARLKQSFFIHGLQKAFLLFLSFFLFFASLELFLYFTNLDIKSLEPSLYYHSSNEKIFRYSSDIERVYELIPGKTASESINHPKEIKYKDKKREYTVNNLGFRDKKNRNSIKLPGVTRIVVLGGSNTYGAMVGDEDSYPAIMERILNEKYPGKFEVWNAGLSAYVTSQKIVYAEKILKEYNPDILIFELGNQGRRKFLLEDKHFEAIFKKGKEFFEENLPLLILNSSNQGMRNIHYFLVRHCRGYRLIVANLNNIIIGQVMAALKLPVRADGNRDHMTKSKYLDEKYREYGNSVSDRLFVDFFKSNPELKKVIFSGDSAGTPLLAEAEGRFKNTFYLNLFNSKLGLPPEYYETHPPSYVYEWYAKELIKLLEDKKYIN